MDLAAEQYGFNDHAYRRFTETIKDAARSERDPLAREARASGRRGMREDADAISGDLEPEITDPQYEFAQETLQSGRSASDTSLGCMVR